MLRTIGSCLSIHSGETVQTEALFLNWTLAWLNVGPVKYYVVNYNEGNNLLGDEHGVNSYDNTMNKTSSPSIQDD